MIIDGKAAIWNDYQKEIADDNFFYLRSCIRQNFNPGAEVTFLRILRDILGKNVKEHPCHTTCTGIGYHTDIVPFETTMTVVARQFSLMNEMESINIIVSCVTSFGLYNEILETWKHFPGVKEKVLVHLFNATGRTFKEPANLVHSSDVIYKFKKEIAEKAKYKLVNKHTGEPLKVVEHIGCHYAKMFPDKGVGGAEFPCVLSGVTEEWGGEIIDYPERRHCCGFGFRQYLVQANRGYSISASKKKLESMKPYKPDLIITNCPGCNMFLDRWQYTLNEMDGVTYGNDGKGIPVFSAEEIAGLVLGFDPWDIGLQMHQVDTESLLSKMGVEYDPGKKYLGKEGKFLGNPIVAQINK